jgi:hypothetical protein
VSPVAGAHAEPAGVVKPLPADDAVEDDSSSRSRSAFTLNSSARNIFMLRTIRSDASSTAICAGASPSRGTVGAGRCRSPSDDGADGQLGLSSR